MALALNPASVFSCVSLRATCTALCVCVCAHGRFCVSVYLPLMKRPYFVLGRGEAASARQQRSILMRSGHNRAVDWWSLGALMYDMLTGAVS